MIEIKKEEWDDLTSDMKSIKNLLGGDNYADGFVQKTKSRLLRLEIVVTVIVAFMVGVIVGDVEALIRIFS